MSGSFLQRWGNYCNNWLNALTRVCVGSSLSFVPAIQGCRKQGLTRSFEPKRHGPQERNRRTKSGVGQKIRRHSSNLSNINPDNEGQHSHYAGEYESPTSSGGYIGTGSSVTRGEAEEITQQISITNEQMKLQAGMLRERLEKARFSKLLWLLNERSRTNNV